MGAKEFGGGWEVNPLLRAGNSAGRLGQFARWVSMALVITMLPCVSGISVAQGTGEHAAGREEPTGYSPSRGFPVFDGTQYRNKPDMARYGIRPATIIYQGRLWPEKVRLGELPSEQIVRFVARDAARQGHLTILDIEHWRLQTNAEARDNIPKLITVLETFRDEARTLQIGYFGILPLRDYGRARMGCGSMHYKHWQTENDRLKPLADAVDAIFPEAYTDSPDQEEWVKFATGMMAESRRYGKEVYVFLWPQYNRLNKELGGQYLPPDFWQLQLETARRTADGIVIWGGWDFLQWEPAEWDPVAQWWAVTKNFLRGIQN